jgi:hypothetical protein
MAAGAQRPSPIAQRFVSLRKPGPDASTGARAPAAPERRPPKSRPPEHRKPGPDANPGRLSTGRPSTGRPITANAQQ